MLVTDNLNGSFYPIKLFNGTLSSHTHSARRMSFYRPLCYNSRVHCPLLQCLRTANAILACPHVDLSGFGVTCSPRDPRFAGSNPTEVDGFFRT